MTVLLGPRSLFLGVVVLIAAALGSWLIWRLVDRDSDPSVPDMHPTAELIARGEYLTRAADCAACHNAPGGKPFSGGLAFKLPFGTIYSTNITADRETGIGTWSDVISSARFTAGSRKTAPISIRLSPIPLTQS